jgi:probable phosphoglycerate mutase
MAREVYILRHGNTFDKGDVVTRVGARTDLPLSSSGQIQAAQLAEHFQTISFGEIYSSPLLRTMQTAQAIAGLQSRSVPIQKTEFLKEIDYGPDENKPEAEVVARLGQEAIRLWDANSVAPVDWHVDPEAITQSWREFFLRLAKSESQKPVLVVTSNGIARFILSIVTTKPATNISRKLSTAAYGIVELHQNGQISVSDWNCRV